MKFRVRVSLEIRYAGNILGPAFPYPKLTLYTVYSS